MMTMRFCLYVAAIMAPLCVAEVAPLESSERQLVDQQVCSQLRGQIQANTTTEQIKNSCKCSALSNGDTRVACGRNNACISSDGASPMSGDFFSTFTLSGTGPTYTQTITEETCFVYPSNMYGGKKVCVTSTASGLGTSFACQITVGGSPCIVCRYCPVNPVNLLSFDCTNLGYEYRTTCGDNNTNDSILQFLYKPELATGCSGGSSSSGGAPSPGGAPTSATSASNPTGGAIMVNAVMSIFFGFIPVILMG